MAVDKQVVITITVLPLAKGKRRIIVSGAPEGEMPAVHSGEFAQVHQLINTTWAELMKRKAQVPKLTAPKTEPAKATKGDSGQAVSDEGDEGDQMVASETDAPEAEPAPAAGDLPVIEGDTGADAGTDAGATGDSTDEPTPLLSSLSETPEEVADNG